MYSGVTKLIAPGVLLQRDLRIPLSDGTRLALNAFHPTDELPHPAILSVTPYGKDNLPDRKGMLMMRFAGVRFGRLNCSRWTGFESPDPLFWVRRRYAVVQADVRGMHQSEGSAGVLRNQDANDYAELIAWAAAQPWCNGHVGLLGVSYLAMSQWRVAALQPAALRAICPWEGVTDLLRELAYQDGIPETGFLPIWWKQRIVRDHNRRFPMAEDFLSDSMRHPLDDSYWAEKRPSLERIEVPALVCASWSDQGLHSRGSMIGFERIGSKQKWLFTHGRKKWETFYSQDALEVQTRFFDRFLQGLDNGMDATPRIRLECRRAFYQADIRTEETWPLAQVKPTPLYLSASPGALESEPSRAEGIITYRSTARWLNRRASFVHTFGYDAELTGSMRLKLWVSAPEADDLDLFVTLRKIGRDDREVFFSGYNGYRRDGVAKGWLRASHRELDPALSTPLRPWHTHRVERKISQNEIVPVEIEILPSSTLFEAGTSVRLDIQGGDAARYPAFAHRRTVNRGTHRIHCGGRFDSQLVVPLVIR